MTPHRLATASLALSLTTTVLAGYIALRPGPESADLSPDLGFVTAELFSLSQEVSSMSDSVDLLPTETPEPIDLSSIETRLNDLANRVDGIGHDEVNSRIDDLYSRIDDVCIALGYIPPYEGC